MHADVAFIIPFYNEIMVGFLVYAGLMNGADKIYQVALRPLLKENEQLIDAQLKEAEAKASELKSQAQDAIKAHTE